MRFTTVSLSMLVSAGLSAAHEPPAATKDQEAKHRGCAKRQVATLGQAAALSAISAISSTERRTFGSYGHLTGVQLTFTGT